MNPQAKAFIDLAAQRAILGERLDQAIMRVIDHGGYIMGPEAGQFEKALSSFCGAKYALGCSNGTDARALALMALGVKSGDAVFCPSFTFAVTAEVVAWIGATSVFVDVHEHTFNMDAEAWRRRSAQPSRGISSRWA